MRGGLLAVLAVSVVLKCCNSATVPANPCPNLFKYFQNNNGAVYGRLEFENDYSGYYRLTMNMSIAAYLLNDKNIKIELQTSANDIVEARPLVYNVYFPVQDVLPKPTRIEFNQRVYCTGPPEELRPGTGVTNMWATTYYRISLPYRPPRPNTFVQDVEIQRVPEVGQSSIPWDSFSIPTRPTNSFTLPTAPPNPFTVPSKPPTNSLLTWPNSFFPTSPSTLPTIATTQKPPPIATIPSIATNVVDRNPGEEGCGSSTITAQQLVVNGDDIIDQQFPWLVAILYRENYFDYKYRCTGSLVSNRHIITAGHCMRYNKALLSKVEDLLLAFGKKNVQGYATGALLRDVQNISVHPDYKQSKGDCDIAVLTVDKPIVFEVDVKPVCLWQEDVDLTKVVGMEGTVVGWGRKGTAEITGDAKKVILPIVSQVECLRSDPRFSNITSNRTFCAGNKNGAGPCHGDSGAGFAMYRNGKWTLRGVVSTALGSLGTCDLYNYFVFVDIAKVRDWISQIMT